MDITDTGGGEELTTVTHAQPRAAHIAVEVHRLVWTGAPEEAVVLWGMAVKPVDGEYWVTTGRAAPSGVEQTLVSTLCAALEVLGSPATVWLPKSVRENVKLGLETIGGVAFKTVRERRSLNRLLDTEMRREIRLMNGESREAAEVGNGAPEHVAMVARARDSDLGLEYLWCPDLRRVSAARPRSLTIAVDASLDGALATDASSFAAAAVSRSGDLVVLTGATNGSINEVELDAITLGLSLITERCLERATILSDSVPAVEIALSVVAGVDVAGRHGIGSQARQRFRAEWLAAVQKTDVHIQHCLSRHGNSLHDAADQLSKAARSRGSLPSNLGEPMFAGELRSIEGRIPSAVAQLDARPLYLFAHLSWPLRRACARFCARLRSGVSRLLSCRVNRLRAASLARLGTRRVALKWPPCAR